MPPLYPYTQKEWFYHLESLLPQLPQSRFIDGKFGEVEAFFLREYPDHAEAHWKMDKFYAALSYLDENIRDFNFGKLTVNGDTQAIATGKVFTALYKYFANATPDMMLDPPSTRVMLQAADEREAQPRP